MKIGDYIYFIGKTNIFCTKNKKYKIIDIKYCLGESDELYEQYIFFYNDLNATDWIQIKNIKKRKFVFNKEFRKLKLNEICKI